MTVSDPTAIDHSGSAEWYRTATRWTQLTFVEDDPLYLDLDFWVDVLRRTRSNAICLSAGGYMAFYPTRIPYHYRSRHLGDSDPFGDLVEAARGLGLHVMARVDPHAIHADAAEAHPEWLARDAAGDPIPHWSFPGVWLTDPFSDYHQDFITEVAVEITREYEIDALFANRWEGHGGVSYASGTARRFTADTGRRLPATDHPGDPAWPDYTRWRSRRLSELVVRWDDAVRAVRPHVRFIPNRGAMLTRDLSRELIDDRYPMFFIDKQGRSGLEASWAPGRIGKRSRGMFPDRPVCLITSVGPEHHATRWKDAVADPHELRAWIVDGFVHGADPWFTKFKAQCFDTRWVEPIAEAYELHERCEPLYSITEPTAEVAILDNVALDPTRPWGGYATPTTHEDGFYQALVAARIPFGYLAAEELRPDRLHGVKVLVLPQCQALSDDQLAVLRRYLAGGGSIVAAHESTLYDERQRPRHDLGLAAEFGVRLIEPARGPIKNNYIELTGDHPITAGFEGADRIIGGTRVIGVSAEPGAGVWFRFIPDYPDLPMEEVYPRLPADRPAVITRDHPGGGRTVYVAFNLGEVHWEALQADHGRLITNAVRWALRDEPRVVLDGPGLVDLAVRENDDDLVVSLVNLTNPMAMRGQQYETVPLPPQRLSVAVPEGVSAVTARLMITDRAVPVRIVDGRAVIMIDPFELLEVVRLSWSR
ncbi:alpha-amylase family protein [Microlunatus speluncae]|uniref:alpha-amylase family protein n=1 Tax=Microlunatus speluncae TaxID=2594267 RepID=UPI00126640F4|nr:alpha-amylase family protein [Microlunatus speluncae]